MGAGKTSTARRLARMCGAASIDMDCYIQRRTRQSIAEIFAEGGEELYSTIETSMLQELVHQQPSFISCAGGIASCNEVKRSVFQQAVVVYLRISPDEARQRISNFKHRPLFGSLENARRVHARCAPLYEEIANIVIDTAHKNMGEIAFDVRRELLNAGVLCVREEG